MTPQEKAKELIKKFEPLVQFKMGVEYDYVLKMAKHNLNIAEHSLNIDKHTFKIIKNNLTIAKHS